MRNNFVFIVFDSCRFDTFKEAKTPNMSRLSALDRRYAYASWTTPSHAVYMMGVSPHKTPKGVFASEVYKNDFQSWTTRLDIPDITFKGFIPELSLASFLKKNGYRTAAYVSMPVLNQTTMFNRHFDEYALMPKHNDFSAIIDKMKFDPETPSFYFLNVGETHYPYALPHEDGKNLPIIHGVHGVFKHMDDFMARSEEKGDNADTKEDQFFSVELMTELKEKQRTNIEYLDKLFEKLYDVIPANTHVMVTSDHGELFGEDGYFGHGPIFHEKVFEVPFIEGKIK